MTRHANAPVMLAAVLLVVAACQQGAPLDSPSTSQAPSFVAAAPTETVEPQPTTRSTRTPAPSAASSTLSPAPTSPSAQPSATRPPRATGQAIPADWTVFDWRDAETGIALPPGWTVSDPDAAAASVKDELKTAGPRDAAIINWWLRLHAAGADRLGAYGQLPGDTFPGASVSVVIETGDASQAAFVSRLTDEYRTVLHATDLTTRSVSTPIGRATELRYTYVLKGTSQSPIEILVFLPSRRSMTVSIDTFDAADELEAFAASIAATIHESREPSLTFSPGPSVEDVDAYITEAVRRLGDLGSYRFDAWSNKQHSELGYRGTLERYDGLRVDGVMSTFMGESDGSAGISSAYRMVISEDWIWGTGSDGQLEPLPNEGETGAFLMALLPEAVLDQYVVPYAADYKRVGSVDHNGVRAVQFRATAAGLAKYARATEFKGKLSADIWIAETGDYLVGAIIDGLGTPVTSGGRTVTPEFHLEVAITNANDPINIVDLPD